MGQTHGTAGPARCSALCRKYHTRFWDYTCKNRVREPLHITATAVLQNTSTSSSQILPAVTQPPESRIS